MQLTVLTEGRETTVRAARRAADGALLLTPDSVRDALGWERKPHGWCQDERCVPARAAAAVEDERGRLDLAGFAALLGQPLAVEQLPDGSAVAVAGAAAERRAEALAGGAAPDFTLRDVHGVPHTLSGLRGRKVALVFWASWCGCRYDLPTWYAQHDALADRGLTVLTVALDRRVEDAAPWIAEAEAAAGGGALTLIDTDALVGDLYHVVNVPTVVWIDEDGRIARPNDTQFATDLFRSMSGIDSSRVLAALRRWVEDGDSGLDEDEVRRHLPRPTSAEQAARTEAALGLWLHRAGHAEAAARRFDRAAELAPHDVATWRSAMPLRGVDPMGDEYFARRAALEEAGLPVYRPLSDWSGAAEAAAGEEAAGAR
ncbi:hypothetical protein GCM10027168_33750 [Streptomyces capparidis]